MQVENRVIYLMFSHTLHESNFIKSLQIKDYLLHKQFFL